MDTGRGFLVTNLISKLSKQVGRKATGYPKNAAGLNPVQSSWLKAITHGANPMLRSFSFLLSNQIDVDPLAEECTLTEAKADQLQAILVSSVSLLTISRTV